MNIFLTSPDPTQCAQSLDNTRVVKMCLETAQLLSTACRMLKVADDDRLEAVGVYRRTHWHHPCALFARKSFPNFKWLVEHGLALAAEFQHRFRSRHASEAVILRAYDEMRDAVHHSRGLTADWEKSCNTLTFSFNCSGFNTGDIHTDYQLCMTKKWKNDVRTPAWTKRGKPSWYNIYN